MDIFKLLASIVKRIITAVTSPFRMLIVRIQRLLNINVISAKLVQPLTSNIKKFLRLKPSRQSDYVKVGRFLVFKRLLQALVLIACAGVFLYFQMFAKKIEAAPVSLVEIQTDVTFRYDDIGIKEFSGIANITAFDGGIVYTGEIERGVCRGNGYLYARDGRLLYQGGFDKNAYNGQGVSYHADGTKQYEGEFADNRYHGAGKLYSAKGALLYSGGFAAGQYEGEGKLYDPQGNLLYEGGFAAGQCHGTGAQYYPDGMLQYRGGFGEGQFQGSGELYDEAGRLLYTGSMHGGQINYRGLVGASLLDVDQAFHETPSIHYIEDGNACFYFEKAGVVVTTDCRAKVAVWEREKENPSDGAYYMPGELGGWPETEPQELPPDAGETAQPQLPAPDPNPDTAAPAWATGPGEQPAIVPMAWVAMDPYDPDSASSQESGSSSESSSSQASDDASSYDFEASRSGWDDYTSAYESQAQEESAPSQSQESLPPDFVDKSVRLWFEVDKDVWRTVADDESDKDAVYKMVYIKRVTVLGHQVPALPDVPPVDDNLPPGVEDCVAIDSIRAKEPTAFEEILYEVDKQNKLFQQVWNISHASGIHQKIYTGSSVTYRLCYQTDSAQLPAYYTMEA